jgi:NMD protein affecting ribosome stability and mRNA decay
MCLCLCVGVVGVPQVTILWCKECGRYLQPPKHWVRAEPESKELLTFCTKRIKGLTVSQAYE